MGVIAFGYDRVLGLFKNRNIIVSSGMSSKLFTCSFSRFLTIAGARIVGSSARLATVQNLRDERKNR
jgi:hypothetical protein